MSVAGSSAGAGETNRTGIASGLAKHAPASDTESISSDATQPESVGTAELSEGDIEQMLEVMFEKQNDAQLRHTYSVTNARTSPGCSGDSSICSGRRNLADGDKKLNISSDRKLSRQGKISAFFASQKGA